MMDLSAVRFDDQGLIPAIAQDGATGEVLLLAYMNAEALRRTLRDGEAWFWSRSRAALWRKGETSGHRLLVAATRLNCEANSLLLTVRLEGPGACHTGYRSCYYRALGPDGALTIVAERAFDPDTIYAPGAPQEIAQPSPSLAEPPSPLDAACERDWRALVAGYGQLREERFLGRSRTAALLRDPAWDVAALLARADQELDELRGVLDGTHRHQGGAADVILEASQTGYWLALAAQRAGWAYADWEPHTAILAGWHWLDLNSLTAASDEQRVSRARLFALGRLLARAGIHPALPVARDLAALATRLGEAPAD